MAGILADYLKDGPARTKARDSWIEENVIPFIPPNMRGWLTVGDAINPVSDIRRAGESARVIANPERSTEDKISAAGNMAVDMASVLAPAAGAKYGGDATKAIVDSLAMASMPADDAVQRYLVDEAGAVPLRGGGMSDPTQTGWTFRDVDGSLNSRIAGKENMRVEADTSRIETLPIRQLYATQGTVNPDFATTSSSSGELPLVVRKDGRLYVRDGHHRIVRASEEGASNINARFIDLDGRETDTPLLDWTPTRWTEEDDALLAELMPTDPAEAAGQNVLDLLTSGRASEVTDEMLDLGDPVQNARLNDYLFRNYDLPMDEASRMERAREMGFDNSAPFHGTAADVTAFEPQTVGRNFGSSGDYGAGYYSTGIIDDANRYADFAGKQPLSGDPNVMPLMQRGQQFPIDYRGVFENDLRDMVGVEASGEEITDRLTKTLGVDGVDVWRAEDYRPRQVGPREVIKERVVFDPTNIRSRFARFDPRLSHLRNLSAVGVPAALGTILGLQSPEDELRNYLEQ